MNEVVAAPALRPRSVPQLFDALFGILRQHGWDFFALSVLYHLPVHVFRIAAAFSGRGSLIQQWNPERYLGSLWWTAWNSLAVAATAMAASQVYRDGTTSVRRALNGLRGSGWQLFGVIVAIEIWEAAVSPFALAASPLQAIGTPLFIVMLAWTAPMIPATLVEQVAPWTAIRRAFWLVNGNFWRVAAAIWIVWFVTYITDSGAVNVVFRLTHQPAVSSIADLAIDGILYPLRGIMLAVVYFDCRIRREGYDIEQLIRKP